MNKIKIAAGVAAMMALGLVACEPEQIQQVVKGESITSLDAFWASQRTDQTQRFSVDAAQTQTITGSQGTKITLYANSFQLNGSPVTGMIDIELIEAYEKDDMILLGMNTMGKDPWGWYAQGGYGALESAGEFYFNATQNGQALDITWPYPELSTAGFPSADFNNDMLPFVLEMDSTVANDSVWVPIDSFSNSCADSIQVSLGQSTYCFNFGNNSSWINCDYFYSWGTALTNMTVTLPSGYGNSNTDVMLSFDGLNMITNLYADPVTQAYSLGTNYQAPVGQAVHLVIIAENNGSLGYAIQSFTLTQGHAVTIAPADMQPTTAANLQTQLATLP